MTSWRNLSTTRTNTGPSRRPRKHRELGAGERPQGLILLTGMSCLAGGSCKRCSPSMCFMHGHSHTSTVDGTAPPSQDAETAALGCSTHSNREVGWGGPALCQHPRGTHSSAVTTAVPCLGSHPTTGGSKQSDVDDGTFPPLQPDACSLSLATLHPCSAPYNGSLCPQSPSWATTSRLCAAEQLQVPLGCAASLPHGPATSLALKSHCWQDPRIPVSPCGSPSANLTGEVT